MTPQYPAVPAVMRAQLYTLQCNTFIFTVLAHFPQPHPLTEQTQLTSVVAIIISRNRPTDRPAGADAIADALEELKIASKDEFIVIPPTPKVRDPTAPILPHTNIVICTSPNLKEKLTGDPAKAIVHTTCKDGSDGFTFYLIPTFPEPSWFVGTFVGLSDRVTRPEFLSALLDKLIGDHVVIKIIQERHDCVPNVRDIPLVVRVLLEYADIKVCQVWMPGCQGCAPECQNTICLYMPTPSFDEVASKELKDYLTSASFSFVVDCRGRAAPFRPARGGRIRPMECSECLGLDHYKDDCPITTYPEFLAVHMNDNELESVNIGYTLGSIGNRFDAIASDGFKTVSYRSSRDRQARSYGGAAVVVLADVTFEHS
ncbi:hypothetical protein DFH09DRAFT_1301600 [Mycena vulgaris]|nr:hypothetical protein DFH09DRAFT_1301600 [Mycena vulgaris]